MSQRTSGTGASRHRLSVRPYRRNGSRKQEKGQSDDALDRIQFSSHLKEGFRFSATGPMREFGCASAWYSRVDLDPPFALSIAFEHDTGDLLVRKRTNGGVGVYPADTVWE
jgi:hypothetical protein